jgi:8-oxo-dGTP diphosphatase
VRQVEVASVGQGRMSSGDSGDRFFELSDGSKRWGHFGAAGVLLRHEDESGTRRFFVARRSMRSHDGGTWGVPGGAMHDNETPADAALREFHEEIGYELEDFVVVDVFEDDHGGWSYWTVFVDVAERHEGRESLNWETDEVRWVTADQLVELELFGAFRVTLHHLGVL